MMSQELNKLPVPKDIHVDDLLPHRGRMRLIDSIIELSTGHAVTQSVVKETWPLFDGSAVNPLILVELAAQTAGLHNGLENILKNGTNADKKGWIVGIKTARFFVDTLEIGGQIRVHSENDYFIDNLRGVKCSAEINAATVAEITMQLFQAEPDTSKDLQT